MKHSSDSSSGQQKLVISAAQIARLCDLMQMLRRWWDYLLFAPDDLDKSIMDKGFSIMSEGVMLTRQIAVELGIPLLDVRTLNWAPLLRR